MAKFTTESNYLKVTDISDVTDTVVTITGYERAVVGQGPQAKEKWVVFFEEFKKGMVLNSTNGKTISKALMTDEMDNWVGRKITLFVKEDVEFQGDIVAAIRVRPKAPKA